MFQIIASSLTTLAILLGVFNFATMDSLKYATLDYWLQGSKLGAFTQLTSSDKMSDFPTTYNANLAKTIEVGTTTLPTITDLPALTTANALTSATSLSSIGTITTGIWNGSIIDERYGGTGTSSPTGILWGNGTNLYQIASGTANQILTSNGPNSAPTFQTYAVDQAGTYTWTGLHTFASGPIITASTTITATTTILANSLTNNALIMSGLPYQAPSVRGASSTVPFEDGTGRITWQEPSYPILLTSVASTTAGALKYSADTERSDNSDAYIIKKEIQIRNGGQINVSMEIKNTTGTSGNVRIYVNGVAVGTERTCSTSYKVYDETINVQAYDNVQIYLKDTSGSPTDLAYVKNFRIYYTKSLTGVDGVVNTD